MRSRKAFGIGLTLALLAGSVYLEGVASRAVMMLAPDFLLELADFGREEFDRTAAHRAHHVVMAAPVVLVFVASNSVVEGYLAGKAAFGKKLQGAINGSKADFGIFPANQSEELVGREMFARFQKSVEDGVALGSVLKADALQVLVKNLLGFPDHLAGDAGLVVNALLRSRGQGILLTSNDTVSDECCQAEPGKGVFASRNSESVRPPRRLLKS